MRVHAPGFLMSCYCCFACVSNLDHSSSMELETKMYKCAQIHDKVYWSLLKTYLVKQTR